MASQLKEEQQCTYDYFFLEAMRMKEKKEYDAVSYTHLDVYKRQIIKCRQESSTNYCYTQALAKYERSKRTSDRVYEECIKK